MRFSGEFPSFFTILDFVFCYLISTASYFGLVSMDMVIVKLTLKFVFVNARLLWK